jgi:antitoxin component of MazEF toxin-antitoxin module
MNHTITKIGDAQGVILDDAVIEAAQLQCGDELRVEVREDGTIVFTPVRPSPLREQVTRVIQATMKGYAKTMRRLAEG